MIRRTTWIRDKDLYLKFRHVRVQDRRVTKKKVELDGSLKFLECKGAQNIKWALWIPINKYLLYDSLLRGTYPFIVTIGIETV